MAKFPEPPSSPELVAIGAELKVIPAETLVFRVYFRGGTFPASWNEFRRFGPVDSRFDHHLPPPRVSPDRSIMYVAEDGPTCIAEVFQQTRVVDRADRSPWLVAFDLQRSVTLLDLSGTWPTKAGASMQIHSGIKSRARRWSQAVYEAYPDIEGIKYCSSMNANKPAYALYERAISAVPRLPEIHRALVDPALLPSLGDCANSLGYHLV